jgi:hypothetical protein
MVVLEAIRVTVNPKSPTDLKYEYIPFVKFWSHLSYLRRISMKCGMRVGSP